MKPIELFCLGACILSIAIYGISCIITKKASWQGMNFEGKNAVAAGWAILSIFLFLAIGFIFGCVLTGPK